MKYISAVKHWRGYLWITDKKCKLLIKKSSASDKSKIISSFLGLRSKKYAAFLAVLVRKIRIKKRKGDVDFIELPRNFRELAKYHNYKYNLCKPKDVKIKSADMKDVFSRLNKKRSVKSLLAIAGCLG